MFRCKEWYNHRDNQFKDRYEKAKHVISTITNEEIKSAFSDCVDIVSFDPQYDCDAGLERTFILTRKCDGKLFKCTYFIRTFAYPNSISCWHKLYSVLDVDADKTTYECAEYKCAEFTNNKLKAILENHVKLLGYEVI